MTALCVEKGLDVNDKNARQRVVYAAKKDRVKAWVAEEGNRNDGVLPLTSGQEAEVEPTPSQPYGQPRFQELWEPFREQTRLHCGILSRRSRSQ